jgi:hypothetical protein
MLEMAYGLGKGIDAPMRFPLLGPFSRKLITLGSDSDYVDDPRKITSDFTRRLDFQFIKNWTLSRYSITEQQLEEAESLIDSVTSLPWVLGHPVFSALALDYL